MKNYLIGRLASTSAKAGTVQIFPCTTLVFLITIIIFYRRDLIFFYQLKNNVRRVLRVPAAWVGLNLKILIVTFCPPVVHATLLRFFPVEDVLYN